MAQKIRESKDFTQQIQAELGKQSSAAQEKYQMFTSWQGKDISNKFKEWVERQQHQDGAMLGVPYAVEDNICTADFPTSCGSEMLENYQPPIDAQVVALLKKEGAFLCGKTSLSEFGWGLLADAGGSATYNPLHPKQTAGSGAAAATASGTVAFTLASDTTGEARQGASNCSVLGLKPSYGTISRRGLIGSAPSLEHIGIIAQRAADLSLVLETLAVKDNYDPTSNNHIFNCLALPADQPLHLKVAVPDNWASVSWLQDEVREQFLEKLARLTDLGFQIENVLLPHFFHAPAAGSVIGAVEAFSSLANYDGVRFGLRGEGKHLQEMYIKTRSQGFSRQLKMFLLFGALVSSGNYYHKYFLQGQKLRTVIKKELAGCLEEYDCLLTPTLPFAASLPGKELDDKDWLNFPASTYTMAGNLTGMPSLSFPVSREQNFPLGLHFMCRYGDEPLLLRVAAFLEKSRQNL